jgi:hypothetical protein
MLIFPFEKCSPVMRKLEREVGKVNFFETHFSKRNNVYFRVIFG